MARIKYSETRIERPEGDSKRVIWAYKDHAELGDEFLLRTLLDYYGRANLVLREVGEATGCRTRLWWTPEFNNWADRNTEKIADQTFNLGFFHAENPFEIGVIKDGELKVNPR